MIQHLSSRDITSGRLLAILGKLKDDLVCEKPRLSVRNYTSNHNITLEHKGDEIVGIIAWHLGTVQLPGSTEELPNEMHEIIIDTLCFKDESVRKNLINTLPVVHNPSGRSPGYPSGYTSSSYNNEEKEGDPKKLVLPAAAAAAAAPGGALGGAGSNRYRINRSRSTNFTKKTEGPSAFFSKVTVKTGGRRRHSNRRRRLTSRRR